MGVVEHCEQPTFDVRRLENVFEECFGQAYNTRLVGGASEPLYQPASEEGETHRLFYRHDYFASALHEIAHWCIAGEQRRQLVDFGYWYAPDGRCDNAQRAFEEVEYKPQALEWYFSLACGYRFRLSVDNLDLEQGCIPDTTHFRQRVVEQVRHWQREGVPERAAVFYSALCREFGTGDPANHNPFKLDDLE